MAISARMQALILKIEAADAAHFAMLLERAKKQAAVRAKTFEKQRRASCMLRDLARGVCGSEATAT